MNPSARPSSVVRQVKAAREARGQSRSKAAAAGRINRANLTQIETGARDPRSTTLEALAAAVGSRIAVIHDEGLPLVFDYAELIQVALTAGREDEAYSLIAAMVRQHWSASPIMQVTMSLATPPSINAEWDALIGGLLEALFAFEDAVAVPSWIAEWGPRLPSPWAPPSAPAVTAAEWDEVPDPLGRRNVWIDNDEIQHLARPRP